METLLWCLTIAVLANAAVVSCSGQDIDYKHLSGWASRGSVVPRPSNVRCADRQHGSFCQSDLKGYILCERDGTEIQSLCPPNTRCSCGQECDAKTKPCQPFTPPPVLAADVTAVSHGTLKIIEWPSEAISEYSFTRQQFQAITKDEWQRRGDRQDTTWNAPDGRKHSIGVKSAYIAMDSRESSFTRYAARIHPNSECLSANESAANMSLIDIPKEALYDGIEMIDGQKAHRWLLQTGIGMATEYFYTVEDDAQDIQRPLRYFATINLGPSSSQSLIVNETFVLFYHKLEPLLGLYATKPRVC